MKTKQPKKLKKAVFIAYVPKNVPFNEILAWDDSGFMPVLALIDSIFKTRGTGRHYGWSTKECLPEQEVRITLELLP
jgi:hypothetical protein